MPSTAQTAEKPGKIIASIIRTRRAEMKIGQGELATMIGAHPQTLNKIERGEIDFSRFFPKIETALQMEQGALVLAGSGQHAPPMKPHHPVRATQSALDAPTARFNTLFSENADVPLYASNLTVGEGVMSITAEPVGRAPSPAMFAAVRGAYAVLVSTPTMIPAYEPGDTILVHPHLPAEDHKDVLLRCDLNGAPGADSILARLVSHTRTHWMVREHAATPKAKPRSVARKAYPHCHRVVGSFNR
jgi:DNA-binding XRE family transcriptional regulator